MTLIGLSAASVYPESTAHAFAYAAQIGYDAIEVMVGLDALSQQTSAIKQLIEHHEMPVCAIHSPCLLWTQRVWGTEPWGKLQRSAEMAAEVGADVVVVHPPFRWQKEYAAGFVDGIAALESSTGIAFAVENMYPWRASSRRGMEMYLPGWDPSEQPYAHTTVDLSHAAIARSDVIEMADRLGERLRHVHLTDGSGSAKDEHLVPGRGAMRADEFLAHLAERDFGGPHRPGDQHPPLLLPRGADRRPDRVAGLRAPALRRTRELMASSPSRGRRPGAPDTRAHVLEAARSSFAQQGFRGTTIRAVASAAGVDPALVHHYFGTKDDLFLAAMELPVDPREVIAHVTEGPVEAVAARFLTAFLGVWDDPAIQPALLTVARRVLEPGGGRLLSHGFLPVVVQPIGVRLGLDRAEHRMTLVASQVMGLILMRYVLRVEPLASLSKEAVVETYAPTIQRYLTGDLP